MLPEAYHGAGAYDVRLVAAGFVFLLVLDRYMITHACEEPVECEEHRHAQAKSMGIAAFLGLSAHTLFDGMALGSAAKEGVGLTAPARHRLAQGALVSLSLASILKSEGRRTARILGYAVLTG